ncbi:MAG: rod shape-determining protein [Lachnospiraceae bacterium]|nr:rod shape-determining protein [Lachnospiraceae bacterium]
MAGIREGQGQFVFGLDIGTRSIVGTVGQLEGNKFHVFAQRAKEHETRAMLDGQIHDIIKVGETIRQVKEMLEKDLDRNLTDVCIAAAGRVLRTITTFVEYDFEADKEVTDEDVSALATVGVEKAYEEFQKVNDTDMKFYCVGYTPMRYYMNGYQIGNLEGHKAKSIGLDLIATFLPDDVVDGLYKAVELADLHVANLTLEPIAAIQVAIPEKFRMLNMALVDVGAGTSDISITKDGTITAYGMIPIAGDSLTDIIVQHCLVDFETAEHIKRQSGAQEMVEFSDIMGLPQTISSQEVKELLASSVDNMTKQVAECIRELNGDKPVSAVFVVGGGGMVPGYTEQLAEKLGIVKERVAIRGQEVMQNIIFDMENARKDSLMVTPIGICLSYYEQSNNFIFVEFNGNRIKLYDNGRLSVADAAVQSQFSNEDLFPKRGKALTFTVNGKARMVRGVQGEAAVITVNGEQADIYAQIHNGDKVLLMPSTMGEAAAQELGRLPELSEQLHVYVNGMKIDLPKTAEVNGVRQNEFYQIQENDDIQVRNSYTVQEVAEFLDMPLGGEIRVNDTVAKADTRVYENFTVSWNPEEAYQEMAASIPERETKAGQPDLQEHMTTVQEPQEPMPENVNAHPAQEQVSSADTVTETAQEQSDEQTTVAEDNAPKEIYVIVNGKAVGLKGKDKYVFVDIFDAIDFDLKASRGRAIVTNLNGRSAEYLETLKEGDVIEVYWKELEKK